MKNIHDLALVEIFQSQSWCIGSEPLSIAHFRRLLMNLLSVRSEHNRPDRNNYLTFQSGNPNVQVVAPLDKYNLFNAYNGSVTVASTFDYQSITLVSGEKFAASLDTPVFVPVGSNSVGKLARLSRTDCLVLNLLYQCRATCHDRRFREDQSPDNCNIPLRWSRICSAKNVKYSVILFITAYANSGKVTFNSPTTFAKHLYCPPLIASSVLTTPIVIGDVTVNNDSRRSDVKGNKVSSITPDFRTPLWRGHITRMQLS